MTQDIDVSPVTLAIDGGTPVNETPLAGWPQYSEDEIEAVSAVLRAGRGNYLVGEHGNLFEQEFAAYCGVRHGIALGNGTLALELALRVLNIGVGDEVVVPPRTFIATASAVVRNGATPVFADIENGSQCLDPAAVEAVLTPRSRAILAVHIGGWPCDMEALGEIARRHGLLLIEDCAQAHGATFDGRRVGSFGDAAAFSFCQDKIMSTGGEGGMLLLNDDAMAEQAWAFKDHGKNRRALHACQQDSQAVFCWVHDSFGTNWRLTEMQSAIGRLQLGKLDDWLLRRQANAAVLAQRLQGQAALRIAAVPPRVGHARYKFHVVVEEHALAPGWSRDRIMRSINAEGIPCFYGGCSEIYRERAFVDAGLAPQHPLPVAAYHSRNTMMFNVHPTLGEEDMHRCADAIEKVLRQATR